MFENTGHDMRFLSNIDRLARAQERLADLAELSYLDGLWEQSTKPLQVDAQRGRMIAKLWPQWAPKKEN